MADTWEVTLMNGGPRHSGHPATKIVKVEAFTGSEAEEIAAAREPVKGWQVITKRTKNISLASRSQVAS